MAKKRSETPSSEADKPTLPAKSTNTAKPKPAKKTRPAGSLPWHPFWRGLVSLLVLFHLTAVFSAPWNLLAPPTYPYDYIPPVDGQGVAQPNLAALQKPIVPRSLQGFFHDYLNLLYLNHGYEFFAPDPGPSQVMDYQVTQPNGEVIEGRLPDLDNQWPRLLYHRHMMLAAQEQSPGMGAQAAKHYANHLATIYGGTSQLQLKIHYLLTPAQIVAGRLPDAAEKYETVASTVGHPRASASPPGSHSAEDHSTKNQTTTDQATPRTNSGAQQ